MISAAWPPLAGGAADSEFKLSPTRRSPADPPTPADSAESPSHSRQSRRQCPLGHWQSRSGSRRCSSVLSVFSYSWGALESMQKLGA